MLVSLLFVASTYLPTDPRIVLIGRFDRSDPSSIACQWSACEVRLRVKGATFVATMDETGHDFWQVVVDGKPTETLQPVSGVADYTIALGTDAVHSVSLVKRTEPAVGTTRFRGFDVPGGGLFQAHRHAKTIQFVGDSITCAYGIEGKSEKEHFTPETENAYLGYASQTARDLDADVRILAWSGRRMWPNNTMPAIVDRVLPTETTPLATDDSVPAAVVINLATNDFAVENPNEKGWTSAYEAFIRREWAAYPTARVYVTLGSMMKDDWPVGHKALTTARGYLTRMVARIHDRRLSFVEFDPQRMEDGIGADWHPNLVTQRKMAQRLEAAMRKDLDW